MSDHIGSNGTDRQEDAGKAGRAGLGFRGLERNIVGTILEGAEMANVLSMPRPIYTLKFVKVSLASVMLARRAKWQHLVLCVTSRKLVWSFLEQLGLQFVPVLHRLQG